MALFKLEHRKQITVDVAGSSLVLYEPSALDRCEFFLMGSEQIKLLEASKEEGKDAQIAAYESQFVMGKVSRKQTAFLIAACLKPGREESMTDLQAELEAQPDDVLNSLIKVAYDLSNVQIVQQGKE